MNKTIGVIIGFLVLAIIVLAGLGVFTSKEKQGIDEELVAFAECLDEQGATFFGAWWCPHCQNQHRLFGRKGSKSLPYTECSNPDKSQNDTCNEAEIESYPTWEFADGSRTTGELSIQALSEKTQCPITPAISAFFELDQEESTITPEEN